MAGALILAGGGSTRMGRDKAWLELDGGPLLNHVLALLASRCSPLVVSAAPGQLLPPWSPMSASAQTGPVVERVDDPVADAGPLVGVAAGLARLAAQGVDEAYLGSCDAAGVSPLHVDFMLEQLAAARRRDPRVIAAVPVDPQGRRHPLAAAVCVGPILARAQALLLQGESRLQALVAGAEVATVRAADLPDPRALAPCNTPAQWQELRAQLSRLG